MAALSRLTRQLSEERASLLATEAVQLARSGRLDQAAARLREAAALGHDNIDVQAAFLALHEGQCSSPLIELCRRYAQYHDNKAGESAVAYLRSSQSVNLPSTAALECLTLVLEEPASKLSSSQDAIVAELARGNHQVRQYLAQRLVQSTTEFFEDMFARGDEAANCLRSIVLEMKLWQDEETRLRVEDDLFVLFIAKLLESGHAYDGRALKGITLLLLADTQRLRHHIDEDAFDAFLSALDYRLPADVRGQATLVIAKFMEASELEAQKYLIDFVTTRITKQKAEGLIVSFSAAAQLFPVASNITTQLFLIQNFLPGLMPLLQQKFSSSMVHDSFLALLSAACIDGACRKAIQEHCTSWISHKVSNGTGRQPQMAATILAKLRTANRGGHGGEANKAGQEDVSDLVALFQKSLVAVDSAVVPGDEKETNISDSIEGLAYTSLRAEVKEQLASNPSLIKALLKALEDNPSSPEVTIGGLSIISNLTNYQPNLSEEQKKMSQLKAYANASNLVREVSELDDDTHVEKRCTALVKTGVTATLVKLNRTNPSSITQQLTDKILLSLTRCSTDRGTIAQQGAVKLLIGHCHPRDQHNPKQRKLPSLTSSTSSMSGDQPATPTCTTPVPDPPEKQTPPIPPIPAHALSRILISLHPAHLFPASTTPNITSAIPPLTSLLAPPSPHSRVLADNAPRDLLPIFEALLALTNLLSVPPSSSSNTDIASSLIRNTNDFSYIEDLLLSTSHKRVRRATVEMICNLVAHPAGVLLYADGSRRARERLRILVAMGDVDDDATRSGAGGALAMLTEFHEVRRAIVEDTEKWKRTVEVVLDMVADKDGGLRYRGLVVLGNLLELDLENESGDDVESKERREKVKKKVGEIGGLDKVKSALREVREQNVLEIGVAILKVLLGKM